MPKVIYNLIEVDYKCMQTSRKVDYLVEKKISHQRTIAHDAKSKSYLRLRENSGFFCASPTLYFRLIFIMITLIQGTNASMTSIVIGNTFDADLPQYREGLHIIRLTQLYTFRPSTLRPTVCQIFFENAWQSSDTQLAAAASKMEFDLTSTIQYLAIKSDALWQHGEADMWIVKCKISDNDYFQNSNVFQIKITASTNCVPEPVGVNLGGPVLKALYNGAIPFATVTTDAGAAPTSETTGYNQLYVVDSANSSAVIEGLTWQQLFSNSDLSNCPLQICYISETEICNEIESSQLTTELNGGTSVSIISLRDGSLSKGEQVAFIMCCNTPGLGTYIASRYFRVQAISCTDDSSCVNQNSQFQSSIAPNQPIPLVKIYSGPPTDGLDIVTWYQQIGYYSTNACCKIEFAISAGQTFWKAPTGLQSQPIIESSNGLSMSFLTNTVVLSTYSFVLRSIILSKQNNSVVHYIFSDTLTWTVRAPCSQDQADSITETVLSIKSTALTQLIARSQTGNIADHYQTRTFEQVAGNDCLITSIELWQSSATTSEKLKKSQALQLVDIAPQIPPTTTSPLKSANAQFYPASTNIDQDQQFEIRVYVSTTVFKTFTGGRLIIGCPFYLPSELTITQTILVTNTTTSPKFEFTVPTFTTPHHSACAMIAVAFTLMTKEVQNKRSSIIECSQLGQTTELCNNLQIMPSSCNSGKCYISQTDLGEFHSNNIKTFKLYFIDNGGGEGNPQSSEIITFVYNCQYSDVSSGFQEEQNVNFTQIYQVEAPGKQIIKLVPAIVGIHYCVEKNNVQISYNLVTPNNVNPSVDEVTEVDSSAYQMTVEGTVLSLELIDPQFVKDIGVQEFYVLINYYNTGGRFNTQILSPKINVHVTCGLKSQNIQESKYPDGFAATQEVLSGDEDMLMNTTYKLPVFEPDFPKQCPINLVEVVDQNDVNAQPSKFFQSVDIKTALVAPKNITLVQNYTFWFRVKAEGGYVYMSEQKVLRVQGCRANNKFSFDIDDRVLTQKYFYDDNATNTFNFSLINCTIAFCCKNVEYSISTSNYLSESNKTITPNNSIAIFGKLSSEGQYPVIINTSRLQIVRFYLQAKSQYQTAFSDQFTFTTSCDCLQDTYSVSTKMPEQSNGWSVKRSGSTPVLQVIGFTGVKLTQQWNVSSQFVSTCPMGEVGSCTIVNYRIAKVVDSDTGTIQTDDWVKEKMSISSDGVFKVLDYNQSYSDQQVYIQPFNGIIWSNHSSSTYLAQLSFQNNTIVSNITIVDQNQTNSTNTTANNTEIDTLVTSLDQVGNKEVPLDFLATFPTSLQVIFADEKTSWTYSIPAISTSVKSFQLNGLKSFMSFNSDSKLLVVTKCDEKTKKGTYKIAVKLIGTSQASKSFELLLKVPKVEGCVVQTKVPEEIQNYFKFKGVSKEEVDETKNKLTSKEVVPVKISIQKIDWEGNINFDFNQKLEIPPFVTNNKEDTEGKRLLFGLEDLNVTKYIADIEFVTVGEEAQSEYTLTMKEWTATNMVIQASFSNPSNISQEMVPDKFKIKLVNPQIFVSQSSGLSLLNTYNDTSDSDDNAIDMVATIPKQLPKGVKATTLKQQGASAQTSFTAVIIVQIILQFLLKNVMNEMWQLYFTLQFLGYLFNYGVVYPASADIFNTNLISLIEFKAINPLNLIKLVYPEFDPVDSAKSVSSILADIVEKYMIVCIMAAALILVILVLVIARFIPVLRAKAEQKVVDIKKKMLFNGLIRSVQVSHMKNCQGFQLTFQLFLLGKAVEGNKETMAWVSCTNQFVLILFITAFVYFNQQNLRKRVVRDRIGLAYTGIKLSRNHKAKYYTSLYLLRQYGFVLIGTIFINYGWLQIQLLLLYHLFFASWYLDNRPHYWKIRRIVETVNDVFIQFATYHLIMFSNFVTNFKVQFYAGYSYYIFVVVVALFNIVKITVELTMDAINKRRLNQRKQAKINRAENIKQMLEIKQEIKEFEKLLDEVSMSFSESEESESQGKSTLVRQKATTRRKKFKQLKDVTEDSKEQEESTGPSQIQAKVKEFQPNRSFTQDPQSKEIPEEELEVHTNIKKLNLPEMTINTYFNHENAVQDLFKLKLFNPVTNSMQTLNNNQIDQIFAFCQEFTEAQKHQEWTKLDENPILKQSLFSDTVQGYKHILEDPVYKTDSYITNLDYESKEILKLVIYVLNVKKQKAFEKMKIFYERCQNGTHDRDQYDKIANKQAMFEAHIILLGLERRAKQMVLENLKKLLVK